MTEFLKWDDGTDTRYELVDGDIVAMNPPMAPHARMLAELAGALRARRLCGCAVYAGGGAVLLNSEYRRILLVRFDERWCELWKRVGENWSIEDYIGSAALPLRITTERLPLDEIYAPLEL